MPGAAVRPGLRGSLSRPLTPTRLPAHRAEAEGHQGDAAAVCDGAVTLATPVPRPAREQLTGAGRGESPGLVPAGGRGRWGRLGGATSSNLETWGPRIGARGQGDTLMGPVGKEVTGHMVSGKQRRSEVLAVGRVSPGKGIPEAGPGWGHGSSLPSRARHPARCPRPASLWSTPALGSRAAELQ